MRIVRVAPLPQRDVVNRMQQRYRLGIERWVKTIARTMAYVRQKV